MSELPAPLISGDVDLRNFPFMALDVVRLQASELFAESTPEEFGAAMRLWCWAWHQCPAGSLPDDDAKLAWRAGYGRFVKRWRRVREGALRGFVKCSDGRLYHPSICEMATAAWAKKRRKLNPNADKLNPSPVFEGLSACNSSKQGGDKIREEKKESSSSESEMPRALEADDDDAFSASPEVADLTDRALATAGVPVAAISPRRRRAELAVAGGWLAKGYDADAVLATIAKVMTRNASVPSTLRYFDAPLAETGPPRPNRELIEESDRAYRKLLAAGIPKEEIWQLFPGDIIREADADAVIARRAA